VDNSTVWRRATAGRYGAITRDQSGRQQVETATVERVEGILITDSTLKTAAAPRTHAVRGPHLSPLKIKIDRPPITYEDVRTLIESHLLVRDAQWRRFIASVENLTADILESQAIFAGDQHE
jgi:hypothetical protein